MFLLAIVRACVFCFPIWHAQPTGARTVSMTAHNGQRFICAMPLLNSESFLNGKTDNVNVSLRYLETKGEVSGDTVQAGIIPLSSITQALRREFENKCISLVCSHDQHYCI